MNVSVIINTLNRDYWLKRVLDALMLQTYDDFEIVVVNGPSTDKTDEVLLAYKDIIKIEKCEVPNISVSRNIGIKAAAGDIIVFIDDDAVPMSKYWIEHYVKEFKNNPKLGCIGGKVYDGRGDLLFDSGVVSIWGRPTGVIGNNIDQNVYKQAMGCNCALLRKAIIKIGGFDEYIEYFLDESDVALRINREGYDVAHSLYAHVFHEGARTWEKKSRTHSNWYVIVKNQVYFGYKNSENFSNMEIRKKNILEVSDNYKDMFKTWLKNASITQENYTQFIDMWTKGVSQGEYDGLNSGRQLRFDLTSSADFLKIDKAKTSERLNVCFLISHPVQNKGGITKYTLELAHGLLKLGVNIHIVYCGDENADYMADGINYYSVSQHSLLVDALKPYPLCGNMLKLSYGVYKKVLTLIEMYNIQIVETPLWDFNGLICAEFLNIPTVTRLQSPAKVVFKNHQYDETNDFLLFYEFEKRLIKKSSGIIAISDCIAKTITDTYDIEFGDKLSKNYLGIDDVEFEAVKREDKKIRVFFIGRLERRKGIANLFETITNILSKHNDIEFRLAGANVYDKKLGTTFPDYFKNKYKRFLKNVIFLGEISDEQKERELESCDIFVSPSLYESFGIIFIEAMRHKKPVIGCNTGGMPEIIVNGVTGLLCEPDNSRDLEKALLALIDDKSMRESMGLKGYERFKKLFTREKMSQGTLEIYRRIITRKGKIDGYRNIG
jgi:glycosyltransferase involved in cell wall biosynthesis